MIHLFDTDTMIHLIRGVRITAPRNATQRKRSTTARKIVARCRKLTERGDTFGVSSITVAELEFGARNSQQYETESKAVRKILTPFEIFAFDTMACPAEYGLVRCELETTGKPTGAMDLLIAAHAKALDAIHVTGNTTHFHRIKGLKCQNWLR